MKPSRGRPLQGITILDISRLLPGGFTSLLLRRLGARVIKVEQPGIGDYYRALTGGKEFVDLGHFQELHEGKEFITLDLKTGEGRRLFANLVRKVDIVIESFRPGTMTRLGLSFQQLTRWNRRIILCSITGSGQKGPHSRMAGHDLNYLALSGLLSLIRDDRGSSVVPDFQVADLTSGYRAVMMILAALLGRKRRGTWIDISLESSAREIAQLYRGGASEADWRENPLKKLPNYRVYKVKNRREVVFAALEPKFIQNFSNAMGKGVNIVHQWHRAGLSKIFLKKSLRQWTELQRRYDFCLSPVLTIAEAMGKSPKKKLPPMGRDNQKILKV